jgi:hypothetical protein
LRSALDQRLIPIGKVLRRSFIAVREESGGIPSEQAFGEQTCVEVTRA